MRQSAKRICGVAVRLGLMAGAVALLAASVPWRDTPAPAETVAASVAGGVPAMTPGVFTLVGASHVGWLLAAAGVFLCVPLLQAVRLHGVLRSRGIDLGLAEHLRLAFVGNLLNFAAPFGSTAGDVFKACYAARQTPRRTECATLVLADRLIGLLTLLASVGIIAMLAPADSPLSRIRVFLLTVTVVIACGLGLWHALGRQVAAHAGAMLRRSRYSEILLRVDAAAREVCAAPWALARAVGVTLVLQVCAALSFVCVAAALGIAVGESTPLALYAHFSAGELLKALPGPPQGLGTVELAYVYFFGALGSPAAVVGAAVLVRIVNLACAVPGLYWLARGDYRPRPAAARSPAGTDQTCVVGVPA